MSGPDERRYEHRFHAGNIGDVWKHVALVAVLARVRPRLFVDTHAGAGAYALLPTGEWTEGVGRLLRLDHARAPAAVRRYLELLGAGGERLRTYPGSPRIAAGCLGAGDRLALFERDDVVRGELGRALGDDRRVEIAGGDGLLGLARLEVSAKERLVVLVDPPYESRTDWQAVPDALLGAQGAWRGGTLALWYPIKSYARPNALLARFEAAGIAGTAIELLTAPLTQKKNRLNGSGMFLVGAPEGLVEELAATVAWLGPRVAIFGGHYVSRLVGVGLGSVDGAAPARQGGRP